VEIEVYLLDSLPKLFAEEALQDRLHDDDVALCAAMLGRKYISVDSSSPPQTMDLVFFRTVKREC
jgi:hypothetical protein